MVEVDLRTLFCNHAPRERLDLGMSERSTLGQNNRAAALHASGSQPWL